VSYDQLTDEQYQLADRLELALEAAPPAGLTPSAAARKVGTDTVSARHVLDYLVRHRYAHTSGNGAWTHYHHGRGI
jgi:hypothetical protein